MATDVKSLQIKVDSTDVKSADTNLDKMASSAKTAGSNVTLFESKTKKATTQAKTFGTAMNSARTSTARFSGNVGQAGIQVQQFVGQVQQGTPFLTAFSQQGADLGIVMGAPLVGVIASLGAVLTGVLVSALSDSTTETESLIDRIYEMSDGFEELTAAQRSYALALNAQDIETQEKAIESANESLKIHQYRYQQVKDAYDRYIDGVNSGEIKEDKEQLADYTETLGEFELKLQEAAAEYDTASGKLEEHLDKQRLLTEGYESTAEAIEKQQDAIQKLIDAAKYEADTYGMTAGEVAVYKAALEGANEDQILAIKLSYETVEAKEAEAKALKEAAQEAETAAAAAAKRERDLANIIITEQAKIKAAREAALDAQFEQIDNDIVSLVGDLQTDKEQLEEWYEYQKTLLETATDEQLEVLGGYNEAKLRLDQQYADEAAQITEEKTQEEQDLEEKKQQALAAMTAGFNELMLADNKALFEIGKAGAASMALINAYESASKAWAQTGIYGALSAGAVWASAAANVSSILSTEYGDTSGSSASTSLSTTSTSSSTSTETDNSVNTVHINGSNLSNKEMATILKQVFSSDEILFSKNSAQARAIK